MTTEYTENNIKFILINKKGAWGFIAENMLSAAYGSATKKHAKFMAIKHCNK